MGIKSNHGACTVKGQFQSEVYANLDGSPSYDPSSYEDAIIASIDGEPEPEPEFDASNVEASYTIAEFARMANVSTHRIASVLKKAGVRTIKAGGGHSPLVPLSELKRAFPELWESVLLARGFKG